MTGTRSFMGSMLSLKMCGALATKSGAIRTAYPSGVLLVPASTPISTASAGLVLHDDLLAKRPRQVFAENARGDVGQPPGG